MRGFLYGARSRHPKYLRKFECVYQSFQILALEPSELHLGAAWSARFILNRAPSARCYVNLRSCKQRMLEKKGRPRVRAAPKAFGPLRLEQIAQAELDNPWILGIRNSPEIGRTDVGSRVQELCVVPRVEELGLEFKRVRLSNLGALEN